MKKEKKRNQRYYVPRVKPGIHPALGQAPKKYAARIFQLKVGHRAIGGFFGKNKGDGNGGMLVVPASRTVCPSLVHQMSEMAEREKSS